MALSNLVQIETIDLVLSMVIPVYNEEEGIASTLTHLQETLKASNCPYPPEIVVVNDGYRDNSGHLWLFAGINLIEHR